MIDCKQAQQILADVFPAWVQDLDIGVSAVSETSVRLIVPPSPRVVRVGNIVAGQVLLTLADTAMVLALSNALGEFRPVGTVDLTSSFMKPVRNVGVVCETEILRLGRTMGFCRAMIFEEGKTDVLVHVTATYSIPPSAQTAPK